MGIPDPVRDTQFYDGVVMRRFFAAVIDYLVIFALLAVVAVAGVIFTTLTLGFGGPLAVLLASVTGFLYRWLMISQRSATLGMLATGIELRDPTGSRLDQTQSFLHTLLYTAFAWMIVPMLVGWVLMLGSAHRRLLHDMVMGTVAINRPV